jgi:hypothetical protein
MTNVFLTHVSDSYHKSDILTLEGYYLRLWYEAV